MKSITGFIKGVGSALCSLVDYSVYMPIWTVMSICEYVSMWLVSHFSWNQNTFEAETINYFLREVPEGYSQREDGFEVFANYADKYKFVRIRMKLLCKKGIIKIRATNSIWASTSGMKSYELNKEFRNSINI